MPADIFDHENLPFPGSLPEFQRLFPNDAACAAYLEAIRWQHGFVCVARTRRIHQQVQC